VFLQPRLTAILKILPQPTTNIRRAAQLSSTQDLTQLFKLNAVVFLHWIIPWLQARLSVACDENGSRQGDCEVARNDEVENLGHDRTPFLISTRMLRRVGFTEILRGRQNGFRALGLGMPAIGQGYCPRSRWPPL
jgi:hypothetical protein